jgi:glycosyltransferase involved in cell wall biosynthesis
VQLAIWGQGPDLQALRARADRHGVAGAVHFLGPTADPLAVLRGAAIFVHPSWAESFPYVILEAMSVGAPIVASNVGGVAEALTAGDSGVLVPAADAGALAGALAQLLDDPATRERLGTCARARVERNFTRAAMIAGTLRVYDEALS